MTPHVGAAGDREKQPGAPTPRPRRNREAPRPPSVRPAFARALKATRSGPRGPGRKAPAAPRLLWKAGWVTEEVPFRRRL